MKPVPASARFLLLQIRDRSDPQLIPELKCFARALDCSPAQFVTRSLLYDQAITAELDSVDIVFVGGAGRYSAASNRPIAIPPSGDADWLARAFDLLRDLHEVAKPTFASCWGFQAMSRALGGDVIHDPDSAELGSLMLQTTRAAQDHPVFSHLGRQFLAQVGHEDRVVELPQGAVLMASSDRVANQAFCFPDRPIVATQFHPELDLENLLGRIRTYPEYVERIVGSPYESFAQTCSEAFEAAQLLPRFVTHVLA